MKYSESLKKHKDFQHVYKKGSSYANKYLVMYVLENQTEGNRLGISVSKKVGNSIVRHRLTRLIRESYRLQEDMFSSGRDIVVIARGAAKGKNYRDIESALIHLARLLIYIRGMRDEKDSAWYHRFYQNYYQMQKGYSSCGSITDLVPDMQIEAIEKVRGL